MSQTHGRNATSVSEIRIVRNRLLLSALLVLASTVPAAAGPFRRAPKPDPTLQVPALIETLQNDKDEKARARAAAALDEFDAKTFPDILPALAAALATDPSAAVREDAALAIGKIRPITPQAGYALEQALANDKSIQVRLSVRRSLFQYRILGYFGGGNRDLSVQSSEPPLASGTPAGPATTVLRPTPSPAPFTPTQAVPTPVPAGPKPTPTQSTEPPVAPAAPTRLVEVPAPGSPTPAPGVLTGLPKPVPVVVIPPPAREPVSPPPPPPIDGPALGPPK
jgi:hypothetical protein